MSPTPRRALTIDDPVGGREACHVAHLPESGKTDGGLRQIAVQDIHPNPDQPRKRFDEVTLSFLADSIRERGVLQPIIVRQIAANGFELVAGERRWRAAQLAGLSTIPALVDANADGAGSLELALIENVAREDLTPIEEARTIAVLLHDLKVTATVLAKRLGRSRTDLAHTVRLLDLPDQAIELIDTGALTKGHGKALLAEPDHDRRRVMARRAAEARWSVRTLELDRSNALAIRVRTRGGLPKPSHKSRHNTVYAGVTAEHTTHRSPLDRPPVSSRRTVRSVRSINSRLSGLGLVQSCWRLHRSEVGEQPKPLAQPEQALFGTRL